MSTEKLKSFIQRNCILKGDFYLSAGGGTDVYFDMKRALLDDDFGHYLPHVFYEEAGLQDRQVDLIGGYGMGAALLTPILLRARLVNESQPKPITGLLVRDPKKHGTCYKIENRQSAGKNIIIVDDVLTTGKSVGIAHEAFMDAGYNVMGIFVIVNRADDKTTEKILTKHGTPVSWLFHMAEFI